MYVVGECSWRMCTKADLLQNEYPLRKKKCAHRNTILVLYVSCLAEKRQVEANGRHLIPIVWTIPNSRLAESPFSLGQTPNSCMSGKRIKLLKFHCTWEVGFLNAFLFAALPMRQQSAAIDLAKPDNHYSCIKLQPSVSPHCDKILRLLEFIQSSV